MSEESDLLVSKIRPFLGRVILNDPIKPYIGTTELIPFKVKNEQVDVRFLRYLLLSEDFFKVSSGLMYGKEHPRMHSTDLLNIEVPHHPIEIQIEIADKISEEEAVVKAKQKITRLEARISRVLWHELMHIQ